MTDMRECLGKKKEEMWDRQERTQRLWEEKTESWCS